MLNKQTDEHWMLKAITLGEKGRITAPPNPWVGCVIVKDDQLVGEDFHHAQGEPHAEVLALKEAGIKAQGSTVYVTLEPCCHYGHTPPCADALINAKVKKVVIALVDPDPRVAGKGIEKLRNAGIEVIKGICENEAAKSLEPYLFHRKTGRAYCLVKAAMSMDGRTAAQDGSSQWITTSDIRANGHRLRHESQAIMIGSGTALADHPKLTVRDLTVPVLRQPLRVVLDARGRLKPEGALFDTHLAPTLVITTNQAAEKNIKAWKDSGVEVKVVQESKNGCGVDLKSVLELLGGRGIIQVLVEGGATLMGSLLEEKLINRFKIHIGPRILGSKGKPLFGWDGPTSIELAPVLQLNSVQQFGNCVELDYSM